MGERADRLDWNMAANTAAGPNPGELAEQRGVRDCLQWFTREKQWINEIHLQLCRVPAPTFLEQERAAWFLEQFRALGWEASIDRAGNVIAAVATGALRGPHRAPRYGDAPRDEGRHLVDADGRFRGPGVSDNGAGLAALLAMARAWKLAAEPAGIPARPAAGGQRGRRGRRQPAGHAATSASNRRWPARSRRSWWWMAPTPTTSPPARWAAAASKWPSPDRAAIAGAITAWAIRCTRCAARWRCSPKRAWTGAPKSAFNVGLIEGGSSVNAIAQTARAKVDIRSESNQKMDELVELLTAAVDRARDLENQRATGGKVAGKLKEIGSRPAAALAEDRLILQYLRAVDAHLGIRSHLDCSSTDANIPLSLGHSGHRDRRRRSRAAAPIPPQEWFRPEGRDLGLKRIFLTLLLLCAARPDREAGK